MNSGRRKAKLLEPESLRQEQFATGSENGQTTPILADRSKEIDFKSDYDTSKGRQNVFQDVASTSVSNPSRSYTSQEFVHRSQTVDSSISPRRISTSLVACSSSPASPNRSPTFPFRPNTALRSYQLTQIQLNATINSQTPPDLRHNMQSQSSPDEMSIITESYKIQKHFPINAIPCTSSNWWIDETSEISRQLTAAKSQSIKPTDEYIEHIVLPTDTLQGICLEYNVSAMRLKNENGFSGDSLPITTTKLRIPIDTNYGVNLERSKSKPSTISTRANIRTQKNNCSTQPDKNEFVLKQFSDDKSHYSEDDMLILQDIMQNLKNEMNQANDLDEEKKVEMEQLLKRLESIIAQGDLWNSSFNDRVHDDYGDEVKDTYDSMRKPLIAVAGGTLVTTGAMLVPVPIVPGTLVIYAGLTVLASEFEVAQLALDKMKGPLKEILAHEDEDKMYINTSRIGECVTQWTDLIPSSQDSLINRNDIDKEFISLIETPTNRRNVDEDDTARRRKNEMKRWARNLLNLESNESTINPALSGTQSSNGTKQSLLQRFDSLISSYGEIDETGIASDNGL